MKKTRILALISILLLFVFAFASCEQLLVIPDDGLSAYDIAVKNGFVGTEEEWLASLKGADGKNGADGKDGTNGTDGKDGANGKDGVDGKDGESVIIEQPVNQTINNNEITISGEAIDVKYASSVALKSAVTIASVFTDATTLEPFGAAGAGVIYSVDSNGDAFIITNHHVVYDYHCNTTNKISDNIKIFIYGMVYSDFAISATYVGGSMTYDIAVLKVEGSQILKNAFNRGVICPATLDTSLSVGETVVAVGNPEGEGFSVTSGIVNVLSEYIELDAPDGSGEITVRVLRTDAPVNGGNSGGGLFDAKGRLVGIVNAKIIKSEVDNIGYAIPISLAKSLADNIICFCDGQTNESVKRPFIGVTIDISDITTSYNQTSGDIDIVETVIIDTVDSTGLAYGKLYKNDIIKSVTINGVTTEIARYYQVSETLLNARVGDTVQFVIKRALVGEKTISITFSESDFVAQK